MRIKLSSSVTGCGQPFCGRPTIGRTIRLNGKPVTVAGVAIENFSGAIPLVASADVWISTAAGEGIAPELTSMYCAGAMSMSSAVGRSNPELPPAAQSALDAILNEGRPGSSPQTRARLFGLSRRPLSPYPMRCGRCSSFLL
jgi:hypothetical protein